MLHVQRRGQWTVGASDVWPTHRPCRCERRKERLPWLIREDISLLGRREPTLSLCLIGAQFTVEQTRVKLRGKVRSLSSRVFRCEMEHPRPSCALAPEMVCGAQEARPAEPVFLSLVRS